MAQLSVIAISDNVCPFCYIGLRRLNHAISLYRNTVPSAKDDTITISWHAFALDPTSKVSDGSVPLRQRMAVKFGAARLPMIEQRVKSIGLQDGIVFDYATPRVGSTRDSHRMVKLGRKKSNEMENKVVEEIMRMYFEEGGDITRMADLVAAAEKAGIDAQEARAWLESDQGVEEVDQEIKESITMGVQGVPRFIVNGKFHIDGAQDVQVFLEQLTKARAAVTLSA